MFLRKNLIKNIKEENAITLISVVVTIIVLIILTSITTKIIVGNNNLIGRAHDTRDSLEDTAFKEQLKMEVLKNQMKYKKLVADSLKRSIEANIYNSEVQGEEFPLTVKNTANNKIYVVDGDGEMYDEIVNQQFVARIKGEYYESLQLAVDAVPTDNVQKEIVLLKDTNENISIPENKNIKLNLNLKTVNGGNEATIVSRGTLIIKNGTIKSEQKHALYNYGEATIEGNNTMLTSSSTNIATITNTSNATLNILGRNYRI